MSTPGEAPPIEITGVRRGPAGDLTLVEVEANRGGVRVSFGQMAHPPSGAAVHGVSLDGRPALLQVDRRALSLPVRSAEPLPAVEGVDPDASALDEDRVRSALGPLLPVVADGLYSVTREPLPAPRPPRPGCVSFDAEAPLAVDPGPIAPDDGAPVAAQAGERLYLLLGGRRRWRQGTPVLVLAATFLIEAPGFQARRHDRGAREAFGRSPSRLLPEAPLRDALAALWTEHPDADAAPLTEDVVEPAAQLARAVMMDLGDEDGVLTVSSSTRVGGERTEFIATIQMAPAGASSGAYEVGLISDDGRRLNEAVVREDGRFRATGVRPSGRTLGRCLRRLAREGT